MPYIHCMRRLPFFVFIGLLLALAIGSGSLRAQTVQGVRGSVAEEGSGRPVGGAFVTVVDAAGERIAGGLTSNDGTFLIDVPRPGDFRVRADRIGFQRIDGVRVTIPPGRLVEVELQAPAQAIVIEGVQVESGRRCDLRPESGRQTALLWDEARKALEIALWTDGGGNFVYDAESWVRRYDERGRQLVSERVDRRTHVGRHAFRALSPEQLADEGFVQGTLEEGRSYYAPDAAVLLSDAFLGTHCFQVVDDEGRLGLAFEPVPGRDQPEVEGTLWFAEGTARLDRLEYGYLNVEEAVDDRFGGEVQFEALPGGAWIVREWEIRMPVMAAQRGAFGPARLRVDAVEAAGGRVIEVRDATEPRPIGSWDDDEGWVRGTVVDSTTGRPLEGAVVFISGTNRSARTDDFGDFELSGVPEGAYTLLVDHPRIGELGIVSPTVPVEVDPGEVATARLELPSIRGLVADACGRVGGAAPDPTAAALAGVVRTGGADPGELTVRVSWTQVERVSSAGIGSAETQADIVPDRLGRWGVCRIPVDTTVRVEVIRGEVTGEPVIVGRMEAGESRWLLVESPATESSGD